ncbi:MAG: hypothetical protein CMG25_01070 [Candidatus Marinimicrobia bacterium]|nr:hypothetical protein [Candidatus Neomarinimicrobiota bacterium]|tara:strand:- start:1944 stop:2525 length:582 start_codon:yes stop_codon:yes gene_type:complete
MKFKYLYILYFITGCSFYSFKGSIPPHINSVYISPIENHTIESSASEVIKIQMDESIIKENVLKLLPLDEADSRIDIILISFSDKAYSYDFDQNTESADDKYEIVNEYRITIKAKIAWYDLVNNELLFENQISAWGAYDPGVGDIGQDNIDNDSDTYIDGDDDDEYGLPRESAIRIASKKISDSIINSIVSTW